jgi:hypothetical protein|tara:strand:+ start:120 stop:314 length:195 start_codon:yes stop_codon:yes gene_type:complete
MEQTNICPVDNIVRWRYAKEDGAKKKEHNENKLNYIERTDGTLGSNGFDINDIDPASIPQQPVS